MDLFGKKKIKVLQEKLNESIQSTIELEKSIKTLTCINELILNDNEVLKKENDNLKELTAYLQNKLDARIKLDKSKKAKKVKVKSKKAKK